MTTKQIERFGQTESIWLVEDQYTNISKNFHQNICNVIALNANFSFSHYKFVEI